MLLQRHSSSAARCHAGQGGRGHGTTNAPLHLKGNSTCSSATLTHSLLSGPEAAEHMPSHVFIERDREPPPGMSGARLGELGVDIGVSEGGPVQGALHLFLGAAERWGLGGIRPDGVDLVCGGLGAQPGDAARQGA